MTFANGANSNTISGNVIDHSFSTGIDVAFGGTNGGPNFNTFTGNIITNCGFGQTASGSGSGVHVGAASSTAANVFQGGRIGSNREYGIVFGTLGGTGGGANNAVQEVSLDNNALGPFSHDGTDGSTLVIEMDYNSAFTFAIINSSSQPLYRPGSQIYCRDCVSNCSAGSGSGGACVNVNGAWVH